MYKVMMMDIFGDVQQISNVVEIDHENNWLRTSDEQLVDTEGCQIVVNDDDEKWN